MLLQRLAEFAGRLELPPAGYGKLRVRWLADLDPEGRFLKIVDLATSNKGQDARGIEVLAPDLRRSGDKLVARLLLDNGEYALGVARPDVPPEKVALRHKSFVDQVRDCAKATGEPAVAAVLRFLEAGLPGLSLPADFDPSLNVTFAVAGEWTIRLKSVQAYWARLMNPEHTAGDGKEPVMTCLVCGRERPAVERLPVPIKGIPGGQTTGMPLISANEDAYESYGLKASHIAPICYECAEVTHKAANALIEGVEGAPIRIGSMLYVGWTREPVGWDWSSFMLSPSADQVRALLTAPLGGRAESLTVDDTAFYAVALTASGARIVVRDWMDTTLGQVKANLRRYFARQRIVSPDGSEGRPLSLFELAVATVRDLKDLTPQVPTLLLRHALLGSPLPGWLLYQAVRRNRAEQRLTHARAALIKMCIVDHLNLTSGEDDLVSLVPDHPSRAYQCGRLLAVLESIQRQAISAKSTLVDRYYGAASSAPASVFGPLLRNAQAHLSKLRKNPPTRGAYEALSQRLEEVLGHFVPPEFPRVLGLEDQALFALGYYHQRAHDRAAARNRRQSQGDTEPDKGEESA